MYYPQKLIDETNSLEELFDKYRTYIDKDGIKRYITRESFESFKLGYDWYKDILKEDLPQFSIEEILKINEHFHQLKEILFKGNSQTFLNFLEFEQRKGLL